MSATADAAPAPGDPPPPLRVLHLMKGLDAGGAEHLLLLAARLGDRSRVEPRVAYLLPTHVALLDDLRRTGIAVTCLEGVPWWDPRWVLRLRRSLRADPVDVVHAHAPLLATGARLAAASLPRSRRPRLVVTLHNMWESHHVAVRALDRLTWRLDDLRLTVSEAVRGSLPPAARARARTQLHGIEVSAVRAGADRDAVRAELGVTPEQVLIGTVANLKPNKGYPDLVAAASRVVAAEPRVRFVAVGDGPLHDELLARRDAAGLGDALRFLGRRADATRVASGFDVFCLSSVHEGLPLALMEALALGLPVVVTDVGGNRELVTDGVEGVLVPPSRPDLLADALVALAGDPERRRRHGRAARTAGDGLDAGRAVAEVEQHYRDVRGAVHRAAAPPDDSVDPIGHPHG